MSAVDAARPPAPSATGALEHVVTARFVDELGEARGKAASVAIDAGLDEHPEALGPVELLLASLSACMMKGALRAARLNRFTIDAVEVRLIGTRQDSPPRLVRIDYELLLATDEPDRRLELVHRNVLKFGTITATLAAALELSGRVGRLERPSTGARAGHRGW